MQILSRVLAQELSSLDIPARSVTVTEAKVSPDLRHALIFVMPLGGDDLPASHLANLLNENVRRIQKEFNKYIDLKYTPKLKFAADESLEKSERVNDIINSARFKKPE